MASPEPTFPGGTWVLVLLVVLSSTTYGCQGARLTPQTNNTSLAFGEKPVTISAGDVIDEINRIESEFNSQVIDRNTVTCNIVTHFLAAFPSYNAIVVHSQHLASLVESYHDSITVPTGRFSDTTFDTYVFLSGIFTLLGEGGEINWCIGGNWVQDGSTVTFSNRD